MPETAEINLGEFHTASVDRIRLTLTKDGVAWSGIDSVTLTFEKPDRETTFERSCTLEDDDDGVWYYDTTTDDIPDEAASLGWWTLGVKVVDGSVVKYYPYEIGLNVNDHP